MSAQSTSPALPPSTPPPPPVLVSPKHLVFQRNASQILRKAAKQAEEQESLKRSIPSSGAAGGAGVYGPGAGASGAAAAAAAAAQAASTTPRVGGGAGSVRKKRRWDDGTPAAGTIGDGDETPAVASGKAVSDWDADVATPVRSRSFGGGETPGRTPGGGGGGGETPGRSRWDQTPSRDAQVGEG